MNWSVWICIHSCSYAHYILSYCSIICPNRYKLDNFEVQMMCRIWSTHCECARTCANFFFCYSQGLIILLFLDWNCELLVKFIINALSKYVYSKVSIKHPTVSDWVPKKDSANFESDAFLWFAYVAKIATFSGRLWIFG